MQGITLHQWYIIIGSLVGITGLLMLSWSGGGPSLEDMERAAREQAITNGTGKKKDGPNKRAYQQDSWGGAYQSRISLTEPRRRSLMSALALEV